MRILLALLLLLPFGLNAATVFTEFYCDSTVGTNINSGSTTNAAATFTSVNGNFNGSTTFTPTDGSTPASTVSAGDWAAIYIDGATNLVQSGSGGYIVRITSVAAGVNGAITVSTTAFAGTAPSSSATGRSIKVGGAWNGPYGSIGFPFGFLATTATNAPNVFPRCNLKNTAQYNVTAAMTHALAGPSRFEGMTLTPGDGGKAVIDGGSPGTAYVILTASGVNGDYANLRFQNNGTGTAVNIGVHFSGGEQLVSGCVFAGMNRVGCYVTGGGTTIYECEAYGNNTSNGSGFGAFMAAAAGNTFIRCNSHDNAGSNTEGFMVATTDCTLIQCISDSNGKSGFSTSTGATGYLHFLGCDAYNNVGTGINLTAATPTALVVENCNLVKNGLFGLDSSGSALRSGIIANCGLGSGTQTNSSGSFGANLSGLMTIGTTLYAADQTPWTDPANGDFRINLTTAKAAGRGAFTLYSTNSPTVAFPDIGAAQSASTNAAASGGGSYTFAQ